MIAQIVDGNVFIIYQVQKRTERFMATTTNLIPTCSSVGIKTFNAILPQ